MVGRGRDNADALADLALRQLTRALRLATEALAFVDVPTEDDLVGIQALQDRVSELELSTIGLLIASGASWERLASAVGVTRQSLHYRTWNRVSTDLRTWTQGQPPGVRRASAESEWGLHVALLQRRVTELEQTSPRGASLRIARRLRG